MLTRLKLEAMWLIEAAYRTFHRFLKKIIAIAFAVVMIVLVQRVLVKPDRELCAVNSGVAYAQSENQWSPPAQIPYYYDLLRAPILVADGANTVHAFDIRVDSPLDFTILYRRWDKDQGWSIPSDIIIPTYAGFAPILRGVTLDEKGFLHLVYSGGDLSGGNIFYSSAHVSRATSSTNWSEPIPITSYAAVDATASIIHFEDGKIVVLFAGERNGAGLYEVHTSNGGQTWSDERLLSRVKGNGLFPASIWLEIDDQEQLHVVWHIANPLGLGVEIRYANIDSTLLSWEDEVVIAYQEIEEDLLGWPSIISRKDELILVYQDGFPPTRWVVYSSDGGETWSDPVRPFPHRGGYGVASLLKDGAGEIHMVLGNRLQDPEIRGMWYSRLVDEQWLPLSPIISGPAADAFGPCCPQAVVSQGNILLATWPHNVAREFLTGAWYSFLELDFPPQKIVVPPDPPEPTISSARITGAENPQSPRMTQTPQTASGRSSNPAGGGMSLSNPLFIGLIPIIFGVVVLYVFRRLAYRNRRSDKQDQSKYEIP